MKYARLLMGKLAGQPTAKQQPFMPIIFHPALGLSQVTHFFVGIKGDNLNNNDFAKSL